MLYHITPSDNVESILEKGLEPRIGRSSRANGETEPAVYLLRDLSDAKYLIETWYYEVFREDMSLLSIDATPEEIGGVIREGWEVVTKERISPTLIEEFLDPGGIDDALGIEY